jgi:hypothetical protein
VNLIISQACDVAAVVLETNAGDVLFHHLPCPAFIDRVNDLFSNPS